MACFHKVVGVIVVTGIAVCGVITIDAVGHCTQGAEIGVEVEEVALRADPCFDVEHAHSPSDEGVGKHT